jgi:hypothetical protein
MKKSDNTTIIAIGSLVALAAIAGLVFAMRNPKKSGGSLTLQLPDKKSTSILGQPLPSSVLESIGKGPASMKEAAAQQPSALAKAIQAATKVL